MGRIRTNKQYIVPGALISASYVSDLYDLVTGNIYETTALSGSLAVTGSIYGTLVGTASWAQSSSRAISASYAPNTGVTKIIAGSNISITPTSGVGQVTISSTGGGGTTGSGDFAVNSGSANYLAVPDTLSIEGKAFVDLGTLPTEDPHNAGQLWRSGNFVMVSLG